MPGNNKPLLTDQFDRLVQEHRNLDVEVKAIAAKSYLTAEQQCQLSRLKKLKLSMKDQIETLRSTL